VFYTVQEEVPRGKTDDGNTLYVLVLDGLEAHRYHYSNSRRGGGGGGGGLPVLNVGGPDNGVFHKHCDASRFAYYFPIIQQKPPATVTGGQTNVATPFVPGLGH
jgi:hypothetical protein